MAKTYSKKDIFDGSLFNDAIKEAQQMSAVLEGLDDKIVKLSNSYKNTLQNANATNKKGIEDIIKVSNQLNAVTEQASKIEKDKIENAERLKKAEMEQIKAYEQFTKEIQKRQAIEEKAQAKREAQYNKEIQQTEKLAQKEAERAQRLSGSYSKVQIKLNQLSNTYRDLAIKKELGLKLTDNEEKRYNSLQSRIQLYDKALKATDASMGKHQRNVGNYASAYNGLNVSVSQLAREMPAFANSVQTGFMAISNNLPMFFDEIQKIKVANKELAATGAPTTSIFKQLAGSIFSVQSLLSIGVTLLTVYGAKMVEWLSGSKKTEAQLKQEAKAREELNKKKREGAEFVGRESAQLIGNLEALKASNAGSKERSEMMAKINDQYGLHLKNMENERDFQLQINAVIKEYIEYQRQAYRIKQNIDLITANLTKQENLISSISKVAKQSKEVIDEAIKSGSYANISRDLGAEQMRIEKILKRQEELRKGLSVSDALKSTDTIMSKQELTDLTNQLRELKLAQLDLYDLEKANKRLETYGINLFNAEQKMSGWNKSTRKQTDSQKELNTELEQTDLYLSRYIELQNDINDSLGKRRIGIINSQAETEFQLQKDIAENLHQYDITKLTELINLRKENEKQYEDEMLKYKIEQVRKRYDAETTEEYAKLEERLKKLLEQEGLSNQQLLDIKKQYELDKQTIADNAVKRKQDADLEVQNLEIQHQDKIIEIDKTANEQIAKDQEELDKILMDNNQKMLEDAEKKRKEDLAKEKEHAKEMMEVRKFYVNGIIDEMKRLSNIREAEYEKEANDQKTLQDKLQAQANAGNIVAQESIAASIEAQKEATIAKQKEQRRQQRLEEMKILYNLIEAKIDKGDSAPKAVGKSLAEMALIKGAARLFDNIKGFYKGTKGKLKDEDTAIRGGKDGHLIWADGDEMIFNPQQTNKLESVGLGKTDDVVNSALMYKLNLGMVNLGAGKQSQAQSQTDIYLKKLVDVMESKGEFYLDPIVVNGIAKGVVSTEIKGNVTKYSEYRPKH